jgi:hypothetical protein
MTQGQTEHPAGVPVPATGATLFAVIGGAVAWTLHFVGSYALVAVGCVAGWPGLRISLAIGTAALAALAAWSTLAAWRGWRRVSPGQGWDSALSEPRGRVAFLMLTGVILGGISLLAILLEGLGTLALPLCGWDVR